MALFGSDVKPEIGYIVDDIAATSLKRGTYKVWIPAKHWKPSREDFSGFGSNFNNLTSSERENAIRSARECYPIFGLTTGGAMPYDTKSGLASSDEAASTINQKTVATVSGKNITKGKSYHPSGDGVNYKFRHTLGAESMLQTYVLGTRSGISINTHTNAPKGNIAKLSIGTKVLVIDQYIIGQLPENQNDWPNFFAPLNQSS